MTPNYALVEQLHLVCQEVLGRVPSPAELGAWRNRLRGGLTVAQLRTQLARSPEAKLVYLFQHLAAAGLTPDHRSEARRRLAKGMEVQEIAGWLLEAVVRPMPRSLPPAPSPRRAPGSTTARGCRTRVPGCA